MRKKNARTEGFCWSDISDTRIRCRLKKNGIYDVKSMSLFSTTQFYEKYFVCLINSTLIGHYVKNFVNNTVSFQINDARQLPIVIPNKEESCEFEELFNKALTKKKNNEDLEELQKTLDKKVEKLYLI